jgi:hypothetical protein
MGVPEPGFRGHFARDAQNVIGWVLPTDDDWRSYGALFAMPDAGSLTATTTLACKRVNADPLAGGDTLASGVPAIDAPDYQESMRLVGQ